MALLRNLHNRSYYRIKIILTFSLLTIILVLILSRVSFYYLKDIYLSQLSEQAMTLADIVSERLDKNFFLFLQVGTPTVSTDEYFRNMTGSNSGSKSTVFLFDSELKIILHSDSSVTRGFPDPRLLLNTNEIEKLDSGETTTSLPFKGDDGNWYLWGFKRISDKYWLGVQESAERLERVDLYSRVFWYIGLAGVLITIILGWIAANSITKPINQLVKFSEAIGKGSNQNHKPQNLKGEMAVLSDALDKMRNSLLESQKEKEHILAQIAHEIRNPLGGIELFAGLIREDQNNSAINSGYPDKILSEVNRLKSLINAFLNYGKPVQPQPEWIDLKSLLCELEMLYSDILQKKQITFSFAVDDRRIYFDSGHLKQIFINLISNSIDAIDNKGKITIQLEGTDDLWKIIVSDSGTGIKPENISQIFDPFYTTRKNGTGLGLSVCKKLANENTANLYLVNKYPGGCSFILTNNIDYENT